MARNIRWVLALTSVSGLFPTWQLMQRCGCVGGYWFYLAAGLALSTVLASAILAIVIPKIKTSKQSDITQWILGFTAATSVGIATQIIGSEVKEAGQIVAAVLSFLISVVLVGVIVILQRYETES